ncbi:MAG: TlpA family protein disulfide reductase, partial [Candidatus Limnocylindria bacterium]
PSTVPGSASPPPTASAVESGGGQPSPTALAGDPLHGLVLRDVRDGTEFTLGQLAADKPVLLEAMAIWCTNCRAQMHRVVEAHRMVDFHSVGVDVDPSELAGDLKAYVEAQGFDWPFVMADAELATLLRQHDSGFLFPPNTPMLLLLPDGSVRPLDFGGYSVDELVAEISGG